jgi:hypothetical protein
LGFSGAILTQGALCDPGLCAETPLAFGFAGLFLDDFQAFDGGFSRPFSGGLSLGVVGAKTWSVNCFSAAG